MSEYYLHPIRRALDLTADSEAKKLNLDPHDIQKNLTLRSPKNESWGDVCTNVLLLLCAEDTALRESASASFLSCFNALEDVQSATLSGTGYINIKIRPDYWVEQLPDIMKDGVLYGVGGNGLTSTMTLHRPNHSDDLLSARQLWNVDALEKLAVFSGEEVIFERWLSDDPKGFSTKIAVAKCTFQRLRLALLSNGKDFAVNFSPLQAVDMAYNNPAFCIPFAHSRIKALLEKSAPETGVNPESDLELVEALDDLDLSLPSEQKIAKFLCHWPLTVKKTLKEKDVVYLTTFLHDLSLLFFELGESVRPQSSDYLIESNTKVARQVLLQTIDRLICSGLDVLGVDIVEELNQ